MGGGKHSCLEEEVYTITDEVGMQANTKTAQLFFATKSDISETKYCEVFTSPPFYFIIF